MSKKTSTNQTRRQLLGTFVYGAVAASFVGPVRAAPKDIAIEVWKSPTCGCCNDRIAHLEENGFHAVKYEVGNSEAREKLGMPVRFGSIGLSVPAMPRGSPGMDGPQYGGVVDPYDVLLIGTDGEATVFQSYR